MPKPLSFLEPPAFCEWCGTQLPAEAERVHNKLYCSIECRKAHYRALRLAPKPVCTCPVCGAEFIRAKSDKRTCSPRCAQIDYKRRTRSGDPARYRRKG